MTSIDCKSVIYYAQFSECILLVSVADDRPEAFGREPGANYHELINGCSVDERPGPQPPTECSTGITDLLFVIDGSGSIGPNDFENIRQFLQNVIRELEIGPQNTQVGVVQYNEQPYTEFHLNSYQTKDQLNGAIQRIGWRNGHTRIGAAIDYARQVELTAQNGDRAIAPNVVVVLTDGISQDATLQPAQLLRNQGATTFAIGVTDAVHDEQLLNIAGSADRVYKIRDFTMLDEGLRTALMNQICTGTSGVTGQGVWIGMEGSGTNYDWIDGSRVDYENWRFGQPEGTQPCVMSEYEPLQRWSTDNCNTVRPYVCKQPPRQIDLQRRQRLKNDILTNGKITPRIRSAVTITKPTTPRTLTKSEAARTIHARKSKQFNRRNSNKFDFTSAEFDKNDERFSVLIDGSETKSDRDDWFNLLRREIQDYETTGVLDDPLSVEYQDYPIQQRSPRPTVRPVRLTVAHVDGQNDEDKIIENNWRNTTWRGWGR